MKSSIMMIVMLCSLQSLAQNLLKGKVFDSENNDPLIGAYIYIPDIRKGTSTDEMGFFELKNLPQGNFILEIGYLGYGTRVIKTKIDGVTSLDIGLNLSVLEISEVVITGIAASTESHLNPIPTLVVDLSTTQSASGSNVVDMISHQPGISQITTGSAISKPVIRGLGFNRVVVLNNGIRQEGQQWGDEHGLEIDQFAVDRAEIIKGPGSLMYGSDALAGVIHFMGPKPVEEGRVLADLSTFYHTNNNLIGYSVMNSGNIKGVNWLIRATDKNAGNYSSSYDGKVYNSGHSELNFNGKIGLNKKWGFVDLYASNFSQKLGLIEGERDENGDFVKEVAVGGSVEVKTVSKADLDGYELNIPKQDVNHFKIGVENQFVFSTSRLSLNLAFQENKRKEFGNVLREDSPELFFLLRTLNYRLKYVLPEINEWQISMGLSGMSQSGFNRGEEFIIPEYQLFDIGGFVFGQKSWEKGHLSGGVRYDLRNINANSLYLDNNGLPTSESNPMSSVKFDNFNRSYSNVSGSLGISYHLSDKSIVKVNAARGFRSPNLAELASNGIHEGTTRYELGNSNLKSETSLQFDIGLAYHSDHVSFEIAIFHNSISQYIFLQKLLSVSGGDSIVDVSNPAPAFQFVQDNANLLGGELAIDIHPHPLDWLHFASSFSFVKGEKSGLSDESRFLPFIPAPRINSQLRANLKKVDSYFKNFFSMLEVNYTFDQNNILSEFDTETATSGYFLLNAGIGSEIVNKDKRVLFNISISANNLLNKSYQNHLSRLKYAPLNSNTGRTGVFNMGRNISFALTIPLEFKSN